MTNPTIGQLTVVRGRPAVIRDVVQNRAREGNFHLISVQYVDGTTFPDEEWISWENESEPQLLSGITFPDILNTETLPDKPSRYSSFNNSYRWTSHNRLTSSRSEQDSALSLISPWYNAVQIEDYQLYPVIKSLLMPRVSLLLADDVGLGKTIEAGLILSELYSRRRIHRTLVVCPASLQRQWKDELLEKFHLEFTIVGREEHNRIRRQLGVDANPWSIHPRIITSMDYLRQPDVLESFRATAMSLWQGVRLPFQMLIVDEAHNLSPNVFGDDSDRCRMLRQMSKYFEHRLFLSATPHNGYTVTFSGLLSILDPVRMQQTATLDDSDRKQVNLLMVRRLKSELKAKGAHKRFAERAVHNIPIELQNHPKERDLYDLLRQFRHAITSKVTSISRRERRICDFVITLLTKRLLSSTYSFGRTWWQHIEGVEIKAEDVSEVENSVNKALSDTGDDSIKNQQEEDAARRTGSWMTQFRSQLSEELQSISNLLEKYGWPAETVQEPENVLENGPKDAKFIKLFEWIESHLRKDGAFIEDERLIVFTEYKNTLEYLVSKFKSLGLEYPQVEFLYGGMETSKREAIKEAFNDPLSPVRILIATDTAAEGLNLQNSCRYAIHYDIPWNPMRLEQRNGRIDRHGQARDVTIYHFSSDDDADYKFLAHVINKVNQAREDLGSLGQVIDQSVIEHFTRREIDADELDKRLDIAGESKQDSEDTEMRDTGSDKDYRDAVNRLKATEKALGLTNQSLADLLQTAIRFEGGAMQKSDDGITYRITTIPPGWKTLVEQSLTLRKGDLQSGIPKIVFDPSYFETVENDRLIFRPKPDTALIRLGHPIMKRALAVTQRMLWDNLDGNQASSLSRWTITQSSSLKKSKVLVVLSCLLEVSNELRETVHQEVLSIPILLATEDIEILGDDDWKELEDVPRPQIEDEALPEAIAKVRSAWAKSEHSVEEFIKKRKKELVGEFRIRFQKRLKEELKFTKADYDVRIKDLEKRDAEWLERQKKAFDKQMAKLSQRELFAQDDIGKEIAMKELEWETFNRENEQLLNLLREERELMIDKIIPQRYTMANLEFWPIGVEFIVGGGSKA